MVRLKLSIRYSRIYLRLYFNLIFQSGYERLDRRKTIVSVKIYEDGERKGGSAFLQMIGMEALKVIMCIVHTYYTEERSSQQLDYIHIPPPA